MKFSGQKKHDKAANSKSLGSIGLAFSVSLVLAASWFCSTAARAQQPSTLSAVYGQGVHAYFAGNSSLAEQLFTQVIQSGSNDPRPYYFRGVLRMGMGRQHEAENDMRIGASFEARNPGIQRSIGRALQRVQGTNRRKLENFRRQARVDRLQQKQHQSQQRYEYLERRAPAVLRQEKPLTLTQPVQSPITNPPVNAPVAPARNTAAQPIAVEPPVVADKAPEPAAPEVAFEEVSADPFGDEEPAVEPMEPAAPVEAPEEVDPFGDDLPTPETAEESDPFGGEVVEEDATEESDPFGEEAAEAGSDLMEEEQPTDENDPFGADESDAFAADENPASANPAVMPPAEAVPAGPVPGGDLFFALGHWLGSQTNSSSAMPAIGLDSEDNLAADDFQFGPKPEANGLPTEFPAEMAPAADAAAEPVVGEDPFGEDVAAADDPFAAEASAKDTVAGDDPFGEEDSVDESDPFGEEASEEMAEEAAADEDDPFADEDDPFGGEF